MLFCSFIDDACKAGVPVVILTAHSKMGEKVTRFVANLPFYASIENGKRCGTLALCQWYDALKMVMPIIHFWRDILVTQDMW